jgi:putative flippase GtrA
VIKALRRMWRGLRRYVPRELVGFAILGAATFGLDLALLALLRAVTALPLPVAVTASYVVAFGLNFTLNRTLNFRSHSPLGRQALKYAVVVATDYVLTVGITTGLSALGMLFLLARVLAAGCAAAFSYTASRYWVFRKQPTTTKASSVTVGDGNQYETPASPLPD